MSGCLGISLGNIQKNIHGCCQSNVTKVALFVIGLLFAGGAVASHFAGLGLPGIVAFSVGGGLSFSLLVAACACSLDQIGANLGFTKAQYRLGCHFKLKNTEEDRKKALYWFNEAAKKNDDGALYELGLFYMIQQDYSQAVDYFFKAFKAGDFRAFGKILEMAETGNAFAEKCVGTCYLCGDGGKERNIDLGLTWLHKAADQDNVDAMYLLADYYWYNSKEEKYDEAIEFLFKAVNGGQHPKAIDILTLMAQDEHVAAQWRLGVCYRNGIKKVVKPNNKEASNWFRKAAEQDYSVAQYDLGVLLAKSEKSQDKTEALEWLLKVAVKGSDDAFSKIQSMAMAEEGSAEAKLCLAKCFENGFVVIKDLGQAQEWYTKAAKAGSSEAEEWLKNLS